MPGDVYTNNRDNWEDLGSRCRFCFTSWLRPHTEGEFSNEKCVKRLLSHHVTSPTLCEYYHYLVVL